MSGDALVHQPPANTVEIEGHRWYVLPRGEGEEPERLLSTTTVAEILTDLKGWAGWLAAKTAIENLPTVLAATQVMLCGNTYKRCSHDWRDRCPACPCRRCEACVQRHLADAHRREAARRAEEGTEVHDIIEFWVLQGGQWPRISPAARPYVDSFERFIADYALTPESWLFTEATVVNRENGTAGTTDGGILFHPGTDKGADLVARVHRAPVLDVVDEQTSARVLVDFKTRERLMEDKVEFYPNHPLQLTNYRHAEVMRLKGSDVEIPMPATDAAAVVQLRTDGYVLRLMRTSRAEYAAFSAAAAFMRWALEEASSAYGVRAFPAPPKPEKVTRRRAAKKATPAAATTGRPARTVAERIGATPRAAVPARIADANPFRLVTPPQPTTAAADGDGIPF